MPTGTTRIAVEFLTLWMGSDRKRAAEQIARVQQDPDGPGADAIITGLLNLNMLTLFRLATAQGATTTDTFYEQATAILRDMSRLLSD
jgi:hypothetical protein